MAVIYCPDCKKEMSDTASVCPNCGYPYAQKKALYLKAVKLMQDCTTSDGFIGVAELFHSVLEFQDSASLEEKCRTQAEVYYQKEKEREEWERQEQLQREQERIRREKEQREHLERERIRQEQERARMVEEEKKRQRKIIERREAFLNRHKAHFAIGAVGLILVVAVSFAVTQFILPEIKYSEAVSLIENGEYGTAKEILLELGDYKDSQELSLTASIKLIQPETISAGLSNTFVINGDGTVTSVGMSGYTLDIGSWTGISSIDSGSYHVLGLKNDGTAVATGSNSEGQCDVSSWENLVAVSAGGWYSVGLTPDGHVVAVGNNNFGQCDVSSWEDIVNISAGYFHTVGIKADGTVLATGANDQDQCDVSAWEDIVSVSAGGWHTVGLKSDGTVVAVGSNTYGQCDVSSWNNIIAISAGENYTVGLKEDGSVVAVGNNANSGQCNVSSWEDIVSISAGRDHTIGLKSDGTLVAVGNNILHKCDVENIKEVMLP